ncbi:MAG: 16S rRNA (cytidine(1402)-2'-O)-methyltransferase [Clostridiales bacterium]|nr:16S rRNA (cytidine(1402)-2'-O)-methyltransferase [Clostridiales bacterium]
MASGRLSVCATPIGNLGDVTARVIERLREADVIAAEDTRVTRTLLARYGIDTPAQAYHAHNLAARTPVLVKRIAEGAHVALVSDAGTPGVSDPGTHLVDACLSAGLAVEVLPGPSAIITALVASGLPTHAFYFGGFLPRRAGERASRLASLATLDATLVFYESPRRTAATLASIAAVLPGRRACVARELTKMHEEVVRAEAGELAELFAQRELKGEVVVLVGPPDAGALAIDVDAVRARLATLAAAGVRRSEAVKRVAVEFGVPRNDVYRIALEEGE